MLLRKRNVNKIIRMYAVGGVIGQMHDPAGSVMDPTQYFQPTQGAVLSQPAFVSADYFKPYAVAKPNYSIDKEAFSKIKGHSNEIEATTSQINAIEQKLSKMDAIDLNSAEAKGYISKLQELSSAGYLAQLENARNITDKAFESTKSNHAEGTMVSKDGRVLVDDGKSYRMIPWAEYAANKDKFQPITGAQLYEQRYKDSRLSFKDNVSALLGHNVGLDKVTDEINKSMSNIGSTSTGGSSKQIAAVKDYIGYISSGGKTSSNYEQIKIAQEAIWDTLPANMRETLKGEAASKVSPTDEKGKKKSVDQLHSEIASAAKDMVTNLVLRGKSYSKESDYAEDIDMGATNKDKDNGSLFINQFRAGTPEVDYHDVNWVSAETGQPINGQGAFIPVTDQEKFAHILPQQKDGQTIYTTLNDVGDMPLIVAGKDISKQLQGKQNFRITGGGKQFVKMPENEQATTASNERIKSYQQQAQTTTDPKLKAHLARLVDLERRAYGSKDYIEYIVTGDSNDFINNKSVFSFNGTDGKSKSAVDSGAHSLFRDQIEKNNPFGIEANSVDKFDADGWNNPYQFKVYVPLDNQQFADGQISKDYQDNARAKQDLQQAQDMLKFYKAAPPRTAK